ncbi:DMT family transporter [Nonomuraea sp. NPDC046570]|uniref:DMT family transporter n=1 Tax=Nonomuraea sp. NPDC046570 TaxID=3155255 RepID=UPI0033C86902
MLLLFVSAAWGSAFPLMKDLMLRVPVDDLLTERYTIAAVALILLRPRCLRGLGRGTWLRGLLLGVLFGVGQSMQAFALGGLSSAVSGFAVGCNVLITPVLALVLFRTRVRARVWTGVALALAGMTVFTLLSSTEGGEFSLGGLGLTLSAAALYSCHTLVLARFSRSNYDAYAITVIQLVTIGLLTGLVAAPDGLVLPATRGDWLILAHLSLVSCALGFLARSFAQRHIAAVPSAVLLSSQPLWVAVIALGFGERIGLSIVVGGALMGAAMLLAVPSRGAPVVVGDPPARVPQRPEADDDLRHAAKRAAQVLATLRGEQSTPAVPPADDYPVTPRFSECRLRAVDGELWSSLARKGTTEPGIERLIEHATEIVRARATPGAEGCLTMPLSGRCLCTMRADTARDIGSLGAADIGVIR